MTPNIDGLASTIMGLSRGSQRFMTAIAGPPGAGKSTISAALAAALSEASPSEVAVLPADGFHYDNILLNRLGLQDRKGAPDTFDCAGFEGLLKRVRMREPVVAPLFDRDLDVARAGAILIGENVSHVVVEGNYLLAGVGPWAVMRQYFDLTIYVDVPREELKRRLLARWTDLGRSRQAAHDWVHGNDLLNVDYVKTTRGEADIVWRWSAENADVPAVSKS